MLSYNNFNIGNSKEPSAVRAAPLLCSWSELPDPSGSSSSDRASQCPDAGTEDTAAVPHGTAEGAAEDRAGSHDHGVGREGASVEAPRGDLIGGDADVPSRQHVVVDGPHLAWVEIRGPDGGRPSDLGGLLPVHR